jgi:hypothetical protein
MAAGVEVLAPAAAGAEPLFANPLERYEFLIRKATPLLPEENDYLAWFKQEYAEMLSLLGQPAARLAVVE